VKGKERAAEEFCKYESAIRSQARRFQLSETEATSATKCWCFNSFFFYDWEFSYQVQKGKGDEGEEMKRVWDINEKGAESQE